ncbi:MAG: NAD-dependent epimerase/dehydratase family protein [Candidatus Latescibacteria bacterium]|jgi:UDP-glucose 4-epimerase|nr:NAD-dependent epimerase/dehydratase family protein [Candidatus Latescibacterota bacterium]
MIPDISQEYSKIIASYSGRRILVLGGTGFIGSTIARRLIEAGAKVTVTTTDQHSGHLSEILARNARIEQLDVRDYDHLCRLVTNQEVLLNFAGISGAAKSNERPLQDLDVNGRGVLNVLEACRIHAPQIRVIFPGSRLQYGVPNYVPVDESHTMNPVTVYGIHKLLSEQYHSLYAENHGLNTTVFRISVVYGYSSQHTRFSDYNVISRFIHTALNDGVIRVFGDGRQARDYIHIDDLVETVLRAGMRGDMVGQAYNTGGGEPIPLIDMAQAIVGNAKRGHIEHVDWPDAQKKIETGDFYYSIDKLAGILNWRPTTTIDEGLTKSLHNFV